MVSQSCYFEGFEPVFGAFGISQSCDMMSQSCYMLLSEYLGFQGGNPHVRERRIKIRLYVRKPIDIIRGIIISPWRGSHL